jgi:hypothetical protein
MSDRDLLAALDAFPSGASISDDPALADVARRLEVDAEARRLRERVEQSDRRLNSALHAVEPPTGLADRLLARLAATEVTPSSAQTPRVPTKSATLRRRLFLAGGLAALAAAVLVAIGLWPEPPEPWTADQVLEAAIALYTRDAPGGGRPLAEAPSNRPPSRDLVPLPENTRWRRVDDALADSDVVMYDIELPGGLRGSLAVFSPRVAVTGLPDRPPSQPATPTTQGVCVAAWEVGDLVYVLVVEGGPREYRRFLKDPSNVIVAQRSAIADRRSRA